MTGRRHHRAGSRWNRHPGKISSNRPARQHGTVLRTSGTVPSSCPGKITQPSGCNRFSRRPSAITPSAGTAGAHGAYAARASARAICSGDRGLKANPQGPHQNRHRRPSCGTTGRRRTGHQTAGSATGRRFSFGTYARTGPSIGPGIPRICTPASSSYGAGGRVSQRPAQSTATSRRLSRARAWSSTSVGRRRPTSTSPMSSPASSRCSSPWSCSWRSCC